MEEINSKSESEEIGELEAIIDRLIEADNRLPVDAIQSARQNRDTITPLLIRLIEDAARDCGQGLVIENRGHFFATYLLAEFGATEAWPAVLAAVSLPGDKPFDLYGDAITEDFGYILAALVGDRSDALDAMIADPQINMYVRWQAVEALLYQIHDGVVTRDSVVERLTDHLEKAIEQGEELAEGLIIRLDDLGAKSALPVIESAFKKGLVDPLMVSLEMVKRNIARGDEAFQETMEGLRRPDDLIAHLSQWSAFRDEDEDDLESSSSGPPALTDGYFDDANFVSENETTSRNEGIKIGRNDMCPCGSGKKYKKCCGRK